MEKSSRGLEDRTCDVLVGTTNYLRDISKYVFQYFFRLQRFFRIFCLKVVNDTNHDARALTGQARTGTSNVDVRVSPKKVTYSYGPPEKPIADR